MTEVQWDSTIVQKLEKITTSKKKTKQAEAEVVPSSSLVKLS